MNRGNKSVLLALRTLMCNTAHVNQPLDAYIIPTGDAHQVRFRNYFLLKILQV